MIAYLEGQILRSEANLIVLKTSDGVGYAVHVSQHLAVKASPEEFITLHIYTNVREDDISLLLCLLLFCIMLMCFVCIGVVCSLVVFNIVLVLCSMFEMF